MDIKYVMDFMEKMGGIDKMDIKDNVTGFVKRGLQHTSNFLTLTTQNFPSERAIGLKFGQK